MIDIVVIGGGAAGLMCAGVAGQRGRSVLVLERNARAGNKILISGGGRCNFTNRHAGPENYLSATPDFCHSALARYRPEDFIALVERHGIPYHEKKLGQLFCDRSSRDILEMLLRECQAGDIEIRTGVEVRAVRREGAGFVVETGAGTIACRRLVVATGGLSLPKLGATDFALRLAPEFGLRVTSLRAGLVPFTFSGPTLELCRGLSGLSIPCSVRVQPLEAEAGKRRAAPTFTENLLFTHRGLSGPAILQISSYWQPPAQVALNLFPDEKARAWLEAQRGSGQQLATVLARHLPERLAARLASAWGGQLPVTRALRDYRGPELDEVAQRLEHWEMQPAGTEGYATAEVTVGGVDTRDLHSRTFEARTVPGLHFIGEAVDVTGWLGGYNFQWAWASGHACAEACAP